jgi:hypothetical protein
MVTCDEVAAWPHGDVGPDVHLTAEDAVFADAAVRADGASPSNPGSAVDIGRRVHACTETSCTGHAQALCRLGPRRKAGRH